VKKIGLIIKNVSKQIGLAYQKHLFKDRSSSSKIGVEKLVLLENCWLGWQFLNSLWKLAG